MKKQTMMGLVAILLILFATAGLSTDWFQNMGLQSGNGDTTTQVADFNPTKLLGKPPTSAPPKDNSDGDAPDGNEPDGTDGPADPLGNDVPGSDNPSDDDPTLTDPPVNDPPVLDPNGVTVKSAAKSGYIEVSYTSKKSRPKQPFLTIVDFTFTNASGSKETHPGYYKGGTSNTWIANANLPKGSYTVSIKQDGSNVGISDGQSITVSKNFARDFIYIDPSNIQRFKKGSKHFFPIGFNTQYFLNGLKDNRKPANSYKAVFEKMMPYFNTARFNISRQMNLMEGVAPGDFNEQAITYVDKVFKLGEQYDINLYVLLDHRTGNQELPIKYLPFEIKAADFNKQWNASSWNKKNGGILSHPRELTTDKQALEIFKARDRYFIARWGWNPNFIVIEMCAEAYLWHHAHPTESLENFRKWQKARYDYMKAIDPYGRLITTGDGMKKYGGKAPTRIGGKGWEWMDFYNAHIHPKVGKKAKFTSLADPAGSVNQHAYAMGNHFEHNQTAHYDLAKKTVWSSAMGYGPTVEQFTDKPGDEFLRVRTLWDRHIYWESLFSAVAGIGMAWDVHGAYVKYDAVSIYRGMAKFAQAAGIPQESFVAVPQASRGQSPLAVNKTKLWAHGMSNSSKTLVHLYHIDETFKLHTESGNNRGATVEVPVNFSGTAKIEFYNTHSGDKMSESTAPVSGGKVQVSCPDFRRDLAIVVSKL